MRWIISGAIVGLLAVAVGVAMFLARPGAPGLPPADTPDDLIDAVFAAATEGRPAVIADVIYADSPEMRAVLLRLGGLLASVQDLAAALDDRFPSEVAALRSDTDGAGRSVSRLLQSAAGGRSGSSAGAESLLRRFLADPYGWAQSSRERVTTVRIGDEQAAVLIDGVPAFGVGLTLRRADDRWWLELPLGLPMVARYTPRTVEEHAILGSMIQVIDNAVMDLAKDVRRGECADLDEAAELAGEKAFPPMVMCFMAYDRAMKSREDATQH